MSLKAVLFDHDGTLVDSESTHMELWRRAVEPFGGFITDDEYWQGLLGVPCEQNAELIIQLRSLDISVDTLVEAKLRHTDQFLASGCFPQIDSADRVLRELAGILRLGLVSGSQRVCVEASLKGHGWSELFEQVVTGDDVVENKPNPASYLAAMELMGLSAGECVAVEDTQAGVMAASAAGIRTVAIRNQFSASHDFSPAAVKVPNLTAAGCWIKSLL